MYPSTNIIPTIRDFLADAYQNNQGSFLAVVIVAAIGVGVGFWIFITVNNHANDIKIRQNAQPAPKE